MGDNASHFSDPQSDEQAANGVQTGLLSCQASELLDKYIGTWAESDRLDGQLLRAICKLAISSPDKALDGFTSIEVVEAVSAVRRRHWSNKKDAEQMSADVRKQWNKLLVLWEKKATGIEQYFGDAGLGIFPRLAKTEGGGTGRTSKYRVEWCDEFPVAVEDRAGDSAVFGQPTAVRYVCEDLEDAGLLIGLLARGYRLEGWRRGIFIGAVLVPIITLSALAILALLLVALVESLDSKQIMNMVIALSAFGLFFWSTSGRAIRLADRKIILAPWWMQSVSDDRLLERREPPRYSQKMIKAVRYTTQCPICGGRVSAKSGGFEFWGRLVGRCEHAPDEHVYSFDHVTRNGRFLR